MPFLPFMKKQIGRTLLWHTPGHEGELALVKGLLLQTRKVIRSGFVNTAIVEHQPPLGHARVIEWCKDDCHRCEDGRVVVHAACERGQLLSFL
jgi:hypothetical protein